MRVALNEESDSIKDRRVDALAAIYELLALHHLLSNRFDEVLVLLFRSEVFL